MARVRPPAGGRPPNALEVFTDREGLIETFTSLLAAKQPSDNDVLVLYGDGGIGKSTLSRKLEADLDSAHISARLDFALDDSILQTDVALYRLKEAFPQFAFPTFSIAVAAYARRFHPDAAFLSDRRGFLAGAGPFADVLEAALDAPVVGVTLRSLVAIEHGARLVSTWWRKRAEPLLSGLASMHYDELLGILPELWARDFRDALLRLGGAASDYEDEALPAVPAPVIFLDTYEKLWRIGLDRENILRRQREAWLVDLVSRLPEVLWVISGRDRLAWPEAYDPVWEQCLQQHLVGRLSNDDAAAFLAKRGITEAEIVATMVANASGVPFYLELEAQLYESTPQGSGARSCSGALMMRL